MSVQRYRAVGVGERLGIVAGEIARPGAIVVGKRGARRQLDGARVIGDRFGICQLLALGIAAVDVSVGRTRIEPDRLIEIGDGAIVFALGQPSAAAIVVGGSRRIELDRLIVVGDRSIEVALASPGDAAIVKRRRVVRIDAQGLVIVGDGAIRFTLVVKRIAAVVVGDGEFRTELDRLIVVRDRVLESCFW